MPLRDHFHPPVSNRTSWEGFHGLWPGIIAQQLASQLSDGFVSEPRVQVGSYYEIDICAFERNVRDVQGFESVRESRAGIATSPQSPPASTLTLDAEFPKQYSYEVLIFDIQRDRRLVAAVEIVSPANKERPESRQLFVAKCLNLLRKGVCLSIVDVVTIRKFNLYTELLSLLELCDPAFFTPSPTYSVTCRKREVGRQSKLDASSFPLAVGRPLPSLPIWLPESQTVTMDLEASYEEACRILRIS